MEDNCMFTYPYPKFQLTPVYKSDPVLVKTHDLFINNQNGFIYNLSANEITLNIWVKSTNTKPHMHNNTVKSETVVIILEMSLRWRHHGHDIVSNHQPHHCLLNRLFACRSKKTSKLRVTGLCAGNSPGTGEFSAQMASNAENVSIWWRHHVLCHRVMA